MLVNFDLPPPLAPAFARLFHRCPAFIEMYEAQRSGTQWREHKTGILSNPGTKTAAVQANIVFFA